MAKLGNRARKLVAAGAVGGAIGLIAAAVAAARPAVVERGENVTYDWRVRRAASAANASDAIVVIDVGDADLASVEALVGVTWPWPRALFAYIADYAVAGGAKAVLLDWIFQDRGVWGVEDLEEFAGAIADNGKTVVGMVTRWSAADPVEATAAFVVPVATVPSRAEAIAAGVRLLAWNARVFVRGDGPVELLVGGASPEAAATSWARLSTIEELEELFGDSDGPGAARASGDADELTASQIVAERVPIDIETSTVALPEVSDVPPMAIVAAAAPAIGSVSQRNDDDGVVRRHAFFLRRDEQVVPSLPMAAFLLANPEARPRFRNGHLEVAGRRLAVEGDGRAVLRYHGARVFRHVGAADVLASVNQLENGQTPAIAPELFRDRYVIVSATARALRDVRISPVAPRHLGAEINALALDNLLAGSVIARAHLAIDAALALLIALLSALAVVGASTASGRPALSFAITAASAAAITGGYALVASWLLEAHQLWVAMLVPLAGAGAALVAGLATASLIDLQGRRFVQEALGRYTSKELVDQLVAHPEKLSLEWGEKREMSVYFSDIAGFTTISETIEPEEMVALLNDYLTKMTDVVLETRGVVDKYIGDAIMAFWGAPVDADDHALQAVTAALEMKRICDRERAGWKARFGVDVYARAGINSGVAVAGNMGSKHKYNYTVMGDMVNLAARLEGANKPYGTFLMVSEATYRATADRFAFRELDYLAVKGKDEPVRVYEVLGEPGEIEAAQARALEAYRTGLEAYRARNFAAALGHFEAALEHHPDGPSALYRERCRHFASEPPAADWDGVWRLKEK